MESGLVDVRTNRHTGKSRLRFYGIAADHLEVIQYALKVAREGLGTEYDSVALDAICQSFLGTHPGKPTGVEFVPGQTL